MHGAKSTQESSRSKTFSSVYINSIYGLKDWETEKKLHRHQLQSNSFFLSKLLFLGILTFIFFLHWTNIFYSVPFDSKMYLIFLLTMPPTAFLCVFVTILHATIPADKIIHDYFVQRIMYVMVFWIIGAFNGIIAYLNRYELCSPMKMMADVECDGFYIPTELMVIQLFLPVLIQHAFPSFGWYPILLVYFICFFQVISEASYSDAIIIAPLLTVSIIYSFGSLLTLRSEALKSYQLSIDIEERRMIEQEALLGQRLRTMISGVAHDLKSPLAALALGLESVKQLSQEAQRKERKLASNGSSGSTSTDSHRDAKTQEYNNIIEWMEATKDAMATIISRCVDVNQALSGVPLTPTYGLVHLNEEVNNVLQFYRDESPQAHIAVRWEPHRTDDVTLPAECWSSVVTDRVWFVQSLLCFVGNAVKFCDYSSQLQHEVEVILTIVDTGNPSVNVFGPSAKHKRGNLKRKVSRISSNSNGKDAPGPYAHGHGSSTGKFIRVEVHDSGVGVAVAMRPSLFTFSGHRLTQMQVGGSGLGLYTMANRILALGGKYGYFPRKLLNGEEKGSVFWFEVPFERDVFSEVGHRSDRQRNQHRNSHSTSSEVHPHKLLPSFSTSQSTIGGSSEKSSTSASFSIDLPQPPSPHVQQSQQTPFSSEHGKAVKLLMVSRDEAVLPSDFRSEKSDEPASPCQSGTRKLSSGLTPMLSASMDCFDDHISANCPQKMQETASAIQISECDENCGETACDLHISKLPLSSKDTSSFDIPAPVTQLLSISKSEAVSASSNKEDSLPSIKPTDNQENTDVPNDSGSNSNLIVSAGSQKSDQIACGVRKVSFSAAKSATALPPALSPSLPSSKQHSPPEINTPAAVLGRNQSSLPPIDYHARHHQHRVPVASHYHPVGNEVGDASSVHSGASVMSNATPRRVTGLHILVVDDSLPIRKMCAMILTQKGHIVETASNGKEALQKMMASVIARQAQEHAEQLFHIRSQHLNDRDKDIDEKILIDAEAKSMVSTLLRQASASSTKFNNIVIDPSVSSTIYDLVLMDIQMPVMDGIESVTRFRHFEEEQLATSSSSVSHSVDDDAIAGSAGSSVGHSVALQLPIIAMSASSDSAIISQAIAAGMSHFIAKPFQMQQFETLIAELMY